MGVDEIKGNGYSADFYTWRAQRNAVSAAQKSNATESFNGRMENIAGAAKREHKVYMKTEDMLFSGGYGSGLSFYIKYAETSTEEDPTVVAKGVDENGNEFEQTIHINDIDPRSATLVQMHALEAYLGVEKSDGLSSLPKGLGNMGLHDRADFMNLFRQSIRDMSRLGQKRLSDYYRYSMQTYEDFAAKKGKSSSKGKSAKVAQNQEKEAAEADKQKSTSETEIITKPDGSRILFITMQVGGMKTVTSIALSGPEPLMGDLKNVGKAEANREETAAKTTGAGGVQEQEAAAENPN